MARDFKPSAPFTTPAELYNPTYSTVKGVRTKTWPKNGERINVSFKTYLGSESTTNDVITVVNTGIVETWYRPDITPESKIKLLESGQEYEVLGVPEDIELRHQWLKFRVQAIKGGG